MNFMAIRQTVVELHQSGTKWWTRLTDLRRLPSSLTRNISFKKPYYLQLGGSFFNAAHITCQVLCYGLAVEYQQQGPCTYSASWCVCVFVSCNLSSTALCQLNHPATVCNHRLQLIHRVSGAVWTHGCLFSVVWRSHRRSWCSR